MNNGRHPIFPLTLLLLLGAVMSVPAWHGWQLLEWKETVKEQLLERLPEEELHSFSAARESPPKDWQWVESHEFIYEGKIYDVVRVDTLENELIYHCFMDKEEDRLKRQIAEVYSDSKDIQGSTTPLFQFIYPTYLAATPISISPDIITPLRSLYLERILSQLVAPPDSPPPRLT